MALGYLLSPSFQVENINGKPLVGGKIIVYRHGTTNPYITYKDFTGDRNPAEIVLNNKGMAVILADSNLIYDVYCKDANDVEQWSRLNVTVSDPIGAGDGRIYNITSEDGSITSTSSVDVQTGVTSFDLSLTNPPNATLTVRHKANKDGTYDTLGTFTATGPNKTITVPKEAYSFQIGNRACFYNDVLMAYLTDKPVFAYEVYSWYDHGQQKQDLYQYMAMKQYWGDSNFYDGTANIQFVRIDVENNKIVMQKCLPEYPGSITCYATWEKTELPLDGGAGVFYADICITTFDDIKAAYDRGDVIMGRSGSDIYPLYSWNLGTSYSDSFSFACLHGNVWYLWTCYQNSTGYEATHGWATPPGMVFFPERQNIADDYNNQRTYAVGDLCYNGSLYRCTTAIPIPENWTAAHWTQTTVAAELADIRSNIPEDKVFHAVYGSTTFAEITDAVTAGKLVFLTGVTGSSDTVYSLTTYTSPRPALAIFHAVNGNTVYKAQIESGTWSTSSTTLATSADLANYQAKLTAGANITIDANNVISATAAPQEQADWAQSDSTAVDYIKNKPTIPVVPDLKPLVAGANITITENANDVTISASGGVKQQADWAQTVTTAVDYIKNKPDLSVYATTTDLSTGLAGKQDVINDLSTIRSGAASGATAVQPSDLATVATTGDYSDLSNKPSIPVVGTIWVS